MKGEYIQHIASVFHAWITRKSRDFLRKCRDKDKLKPRTIVNTVQVLEPFIEFLGDRQLSEDIVYDYIETLDERTFKRQGKEKTYAPSTRYFIETTLKNLLHLIHPN
ncbi:MAG: hypothetical protein NHB15_05885 [Methanosarcina barkeri]|nr:hypothetical protein [Methanosarcina sp. ERenArc_MAG2]